MNCIPNAAAPSEVEAAPFSLVDEHRLRVRSDLASELLTQTVAPATTKPTAAGFGELQFSPDASYAVRLPFTAYVERVHVSTGDRLEPGDVLMTVLSSEVARLRAETRKLSAEQTAAQDAVVRFERLVREGAASERELVEAVALAAALKAQAEGARETLRSLQAEARGSNRLLVRASAAGEVLVRNVDPGERIDGHNEAPAFIIGDAGRLAARGSFPEQDAAGIRAGARCWFELPAMGPRRIEGVTYEVSAMVDARTRTATAHCRPLKPVEGLRAQMLARVEIELDPSASVVIPREAVLLRGDTFVVFVATAEGELERRTVELGKRIGDGIEIVTGLDIGETIVQRGAVLLDGELDRLL